MEVILFKTLGKLNLLIKRLVLLTANIYIAFNHPYPRNMHNLFYPLVIFKKKNILYFRTGFVQKICNLNVHKKVISNSRK